MGSDLCQIPCSLLHFSYMERPLISKSQLFLAFCKCSMLYVNFQVGTFQMHIRLSAKFEFSIRTPNERRLEQFVHVDNSFCYYQGALAWEAKRPYICVLQCGMRGCLFKATAMWPNFIFFLLHCGGNPPNYGLILACFCLSCNLTQ